MVVVDAFVDVEEDAFPVIVGDASLEDPGDASFVEFTIYDGEGFGAAGNLPGISRVIR